MPRSGIGFEHRAHLDYGGSLQAYRATWIAAKSKHIFVGRAHVKHTTHVFVIVKYTTHAHCTHTHCLICEFRRQNHTTDALGGASTSDTLMCGENCCIEPILATLSMAATVTGTLGRLSCILTWGTFPAQRVRTTF